MADHASLRTSRSRIKGLGASGHGAGEFWIQRLTAAANGVLMLAFVVIVAMGAGRTYPDALRLYGSPPVAIILLLAIASVTTHMRIGMKIVIEDYVHAKALKVLALGANNFYAVAVAVACLYAVLRISLGQSA